MIAGKWGGGAASAPLDTGKLHLFKALGELFSQPAVCENVVAPLSGVPFHQDIDCLTRFFAQGFPMHLAVHRVSAAERAERQYTQLHAHPEPEINVVIPDREGLVYRLQIGADVREISGHASVWIPPDVPHSTNVVSGSGHFVALRL